MDVQVVDGLAAIARGVDDGAIAFGEIFLAGNFGGGGEKLAEKLRVTFSSFCERCNVTARRDENVDRRGRIDVSEGKAIIVFVDGGGGNATVNDLAKETAH
jgi:hypothetical protein